MGNISTGKNQVDQSSQNAGLGSASKTSMDEGHHPFAKLPELIGPDEKGFYYHERDKEKVVKDLQFHIEFKFKYNAIDYEPRGNNEQKHNDDDMKDDMKDEIKEDVNNKYDKCRYEWVYIAQDNVDFHRIKEDSYFHPKRNKQEGLPESYEDIRKYLAENDPIPPYFLRRSKMADVVFQQVLTSSLCEVSKLKCRIATRCIGVKLKQKINHPALLVWRKDEEFCKYNDRPVMMIHLTKLPDQYKDEMEMKSGKERIEIQCRPINKYQLDRDEWKYDYEIQDLKVEHGLIDIAHWSLKYEMDNNYQYGKYMNNCRRYMVHLCKAFNIIHDAEQWTDTAIALVEKVSNAPSGTGSKTWGTNSNKSK